VYFLNMATTLTKTAEGGLDSRELADLRDDLVEERRRLDRLLQRVENQLELAQPKSASHAMHNDGTGTKKVPVPRSSPLDSVKKVIAASKDLRESNGNLSADRVARLYGIGLSQLARWLGRTKQALSKTPDADSLQDGLAYFERVARLRLVTENDAEFRKWLRMPNDTLGNRTPLDLMKSGLWQEMADKVDDMLSGMPT
jgi:uncharacterized protein (DUF2384 family)